MMNGAMIAPQDCVENASPVCAPLAWKLAARKVPRVTNQQPQMKNCRNIITLRREAIAYMGVTSGTICFAANTLDRDVLARHHLVLEREHRGSGLVAVSYTHLRAHETPEHLVC